MMRGAGRVFAGGSLLGLLLLGILQFDGVSTWLVARLADRFNPYPGTELTVDRVSGSWIRSLRLEGVRLTPLPGQEHGGAEAALDSIEVHFRLLPLLLRRIEIREAEVMGLRAGLTQRTDSVWNFLAPFQGADEPEAQEEGGGGVRLRSGPIRVRGAAAVSFAPESPGAPPDRLEVEELTVVVAELEVGDGGLVASVDTLYARFLPPGESLDRVVVGGKGAVKEGRVEIPGLTLRSGASDVSAQGTLLLPRGEEGEIEEIEFQFQATPLALRDLSGFVRTLDPAVSAEADLRLQGRASRVEVSGQATLSDGGRLGLEGTFTPSASGPVEYHLQGTSEALRLGSFLGRNRVGGVVDALLVVELEGTDLAHLNGDLSARMEGLQLEGRGTRPLVVSGSFLDGQANVEVEAGVEGLGAMELFLGGRPLDPEPTLEVQGAYRQSRSPADLTQGNSEQTNIRELESHFALETKGYSVDSASAELEVRTLHGAYRGLSLEGGSLKALWRGGEGTFEVSQPLGTGHLATAGEVTWRKDAGADSEVGRVLRYSVPDLELRDLDLSRLLGDTVPSRVNASVTLEGIGTDPGTLDVDVAVRLQESDFRGIALDSAVVRPSLKGGALSAVVEGWLRGSEVEGSAPEDESGGRVLASLQGRPFGTEPFLVLDSLDFSGIDLASIAGLPSHLNGEARARAKGLDPRTGEISGELHLFPSRIGSTPADSGTVVVSLSDGDLRVSTRFSSAAGKLGLSGGVSPFTEPLEFRVDEGEVRGLDLGQVLGREGLQSDLNLDLNLSGSGNSLQELKALGTLVVLPSALNQGNIQGGTLGLEAGGGQGAVRGELRTRDGEVTLQGLASLTATVEDFSVEGDLNLPDLGGFLGWAEAEVEARGEAAVTWNADRGLAFASDLEGRIGEAAIDTLSVSGVLGESALHLDTLRLRSDLLHANGGGRLALQENREGIGEWDLSIAADVIDLSPLAPLVGLEELSAQSGHGKLDITGQTGNLSLVASLDLGPWLINGVRGDSARVRADHDSDGLALAAWIQAPKERGSVDLALRADPGSNEKRGTLEHLAVSTPETQWALETPAPFSWKEGIRVDGLALASDQGRISVDGNVDPQGAQDLTVTFEEALLSGIPRLLGLENPSLMAHGQMTLTGPADSPSIEGNLRLDLAAPEGGSTSADAHFSLLDGDLALDVQALDPAGSPLTLEGTVPLAFSLSQEEDPASSTVRDSLARPLPADGSVDLTLQSQAFDISWFAAFIPRRTIADLAGLLSTDLRATGSLDQPVLEGRIGLKDGLVHISALETTYEDIHLSAELQGREARITEARLTSGQGTAEIQGAIAFDRFQPQELDLTARTSRFLAANTPTVSATLSGDLNLRGSFQEPQLTGNLNLAGSEVGLDNVSAGGEARAGELTEEDYQMLEDYFGYQVGEGGASDFVQRLGLDLDMGPEQETQIRQSGALRVARSEGGVADFVERAGLDLTLSSDQDLWVRRSGSLRVALEVRVDLELKKDPMEDFRVIGTVETLPERSYFRQFGRRFAVQEGELTLTGDPSEFNLHMAAQWEVPSHSNPHEAEVVVNLGVDGDAESLDLTLSSDPAMDEADIVSYLATGKPQGALADSDADAAGLGTSVAMGAMAGFLEGLATEAVELDVVEVQTDPVRGTTLVAGRYVSPNLYVGFRQLVTFSESNRKARTQYQESEVELEYRWFRWLTMNVRGGASEIGLFLRGRYAH